MSKNKFLGVYIILVIIILLGSPVCAKNLMREFEVKQAGAVMGTIQIDLSEDKGNTQLKTLVEYPAQNVTIASEFLFEGIDFPKTPVSYSFSLLKGGILDFNMTWDQTAEYSIAQLGQSFTLPDLNVLPLDNNVISDYMTATWIFDKTSEQTIMSSLILPVQILQVPDPMPMSVAYLGEELLGSYMTDKFQVDIGVKVDIWVDQQDRSLVRLNIPMQAYEIIATDLELEQESERIFDDFGGLDFQEQLIEVVGDDVALSGTLAIPSTAEKKSLPVAIIVAGSGPTDRDGNSYVRPGPIDNLKEIGHYLASQGIATLRFDKRGVGDSSGAITGFQNYIDDISLLVDHIQTYDFIDLDKIYLIGHSEGAWLVSEVAATRHDLAGIVSISGSGFPYYDTLKRQLIAQTDAAIAAGMFDDQLSNRTEHALEDMYYDVLADTVDQYDISQYQLPVELEQTIMSFVLQAEIIKDWLIADPTQSLSKVSIPVLIIQGTADSQILVEDARELAQVLPLDQRELHIFEGVDHALKMTYGEPLPYTDPDRRVDKELLQVIGDWIIAE